MSLQLPIGFIFHQSHSIRNLIAIIGGKGAGKSAHGGANRICRGLWSFSKNPKSKCVNILEDTFLSKASKKTVGNLKPIIGAKVRLSWIDPASTTRQRFPSPYPTASKRKKLSIWPQKFVERVCAPENHSELLADVERVVFQRIPKSDRLGCVTFCRPAHSANEKEYRLKKLTPRLRDRGSPTGAIYAGYLKVESARRKAETFEAAPKGTRRASQAEAGG